MGLFKKLQENSLYWRYRFITRRYLAFRRWRRELRRPGVPGKVSRVQPRGTAAFSPYKRSSRVNYVRGIAFTLAVAAVWTLLLHSAIGSSAFPTFIPQALAVVLIAYAFIRFW